MDSANPKVILLRGDPIYSEGTATAAIRPGMLVNPAGAIRTTIADRTIAPAAAGEVAPNFARENDIVGKGIDDLYAIGDNVLFFHNRRGDQVYALLATANNVVAGDSLSAGAGGLLVKTADDAPVIAKALTAVNNATGAAVRIKVEIV